MVLLRHDLPDGSFHFDWMIEGPQRLPAPPSPEDRCLMTFRLQQRPDDPRVQTFEAERLEDHRRHFLTFEGELTGGRGRVSRLASGTVHSVEATLRTLALQGEFGAMGAAEWRATGIGVAWVFERL